VLVVAGPHRGAAFTDWRRFGYVLDATDRVTGSAVDTLGLFNFPQLQLRSAGFVRATPAGAGDADDGHQELRNE
jgi:hypothetical protein